MPAEILSLDRVGRLPAPGDNVAIAVRRLDPGERVRFGGGDVRCMPYTVLEGHRFAVRPIAAGEPLLSWEFPFGKALGDLLPGEAICNESTAKQLAIRVPDLNAPPRPNFEDWPHEFTFDPAAIRPAPPTARSDTPRQFLGYARPGGRGVGTRNTVVILGTSARSASYARNLADRLQPLAAAARGLDGIAAVAHTEGDGPGVPNNRLEVLRALAGFIVHPNVAAVLIADRGQGAIDNAVLREFMRQERYPLEAVPHRFLTVAGSFEEGLREGEAVIREWLPRVAAKRAPQPLAGLRIALQCGGSDAFSGISGNPLAGAVAHELIRHGGSANLCETDELIGAQNYLLANVRDRGVAEALVRTVEAFQTRLAWHGTTAESNPSAGNKLRGLYNIVLKSLGAAHKKDPRTRLDAVIDYAVRLTDPGFYFMNSPGNDLEGIAGQVGSGCNLIVFVTGNGSVTNFPFVPTLKITTTTARHELLRHEMDINAGRYLDGEPMPALAAEAFETLLATASGQRTRGEQAGHSQVSLWRNWRQTDASQVAAIKGRPAPNGAPLATANDLEARRPDDRPLRLYRAEGRWSTERIGLVLPTSLCSSQIARLAAERLSAAGAGQSAGIERFVALPHTEGCGFGGDSMYELLLRSYAGYATHPNVAAALLLEHGCEKVPNDLVRHRFRAAGIPVDRLGWASVQLDGGIDQVLGKIQRWFEGRTANAAVPRRQPAGWGCLRVGMVTAGAVTAPTEAVLATVVRAVVSAGGTVLVPVDDPLAAAAGFRALAGGRPMRATLANGEAVRSEGLHLVATDSDQWVENLTALGASGAHVLVTVVGGSPRPGHLLIETLQLAEPGAMRGFDSSDVDLVLSGDAPADVESVMERLAAVVSGDRPCAARTCQATDFQFTRGLLGVST